MSIRGPGSGSLGSQGPLHLPSDDLPRTDREKSPEGRPGPGKLQGDPFVVENPEGGRAWSGGRRVPPRRTKLG